mgnify:CR=1 FL=1
MARSSSRSQTPFGCWSDQDGGPRSKVMTDADRSQTPFGCWSDQDKKSSLRNALWSLTVTNAFRLLVRSGLQRSQEGKPPTFIHRSQTPFGCWSDQDLTTNTPRSPLGRGLSQTPFGCWSDQDLMMQAVNPVKYIGGSQTPFGCWSDQDCSTKACRFAKDLSGF